MTILNVTEPDRDSLALERTRLANERTLLAYVRTALSLIAGAAVLFQFFSAVHAYLIVAWILAAAGVATLGIGIFRFRRVGRALRAPGCIHPGSRQVTAVADHV